MTNGAKRRGRLAAALGFTVLGVLVVVLALRSSGSTEQPATAEADVPAAAAPSSPALSGKLPPTPAEAPDERPAAAPASPPTAPATAPAREYHPREQDVAEWMKERAPLHDRWASESGDPSWTNRAASQIARILNDAKLNVNALRDVDCRQTICRFKLRSESTLHRNVSDLIAASRALVEQTFLVPVAVSGGGWDIETYFPKDEYSLEGWYIGKNVTEATNGGT